MCKIRWAKSLNAAQILVQACELTLCLRIVKYYHELPLHSIMREFRCSQSLNAAQIFVWACESSLCQRIFKGHHELPLHSIMREFRWTKSLNAAQILLLLAYLRIISLWAFVIFHHAKWFELNAAKILSFPCESSNNIMKLCYIQSCVSLDGPSL